MISALECGLRNRIRADEDYMIVRSASFVEGALEFRKLSRQEVRRFEKECSDEIRRGSQTCSRFLGHPFLYKIDRVRYCKDQ